MLGSDKTERPTEEESMNRNAGVHAFLPLILHPWTCFFRLCWWVLILLPERFLKNQGSLLNLKRGGGAKEFTVKARLEKTTTCES